MEYINIIVIAFIIIGIIFIVLSFMVKDKTQKSEDTKTEKKLMEELISKNKDIENMDLNKDEIMKEISNKILELNDYSSFIKKELNDKHKELLFLYQLICEKEKNIKKLSNINSIKKKNEIEVIENDDEIIEEDYALDFQNVENKNQKIIDFHKKGYSITDIAKIMALGKGEVKLILELGTTRE
ncbi:hypothetical protein SH1V18_14350 [Vallitalea longa]|uniref:Uncharacterized protein n=1 Tax=Vallitalea longa TaxID=2936439 RepID=A0A9W5YAB0_9FIRM|nr:DUF6115 domain-containing protein [Vallitalea longa]GKX28955.1 hypothetical protein SH1V18_14350 [Vallitalea longa]